MQDTDSNELRYDETLSFHLMALFSNLQNIAKEMWLCLVLYDCRSEFFRGGLNYWVTLNLGTTSWDRDGIAWASIWAMGCHLLWMELEK